MVRALSWTVVGSVSCFCCPPASLNPLFVVYAALWISGNASSLRRVLAISALIFLAASWAFLVLTHTAILIGHIAWVAGVLMIVGMVARGLKIDHGDDLQTSRPDSFPA